MRDRTEGRANSGEAKLTVVDSSGTWDVVLEAGDFVYRAHGSNTGWYRPRKRLLRNTVTQAYEEWERFRAEAAPSEDKRLHEEA